MRPSQKQRILQAFAISLFFLGSLMTLSRAHASLDAVELTMVPANIMVDCNRSFFKSSDPDNKFIYVTPHVVAGRSPIDGEKPGVHVVPTETPGEYILSIDVYFPRDAEDALGTYELRDAHANFCNYESVHHFMNQSLGTLDTDDELEIALLPLTSIEVTIPGLELDAFVVGKVLNEDGVNEEVDILEYNDNSYTAEFKINDRQLDYINERMQRDEGLQLDVKYRFQSRRRDGSIDVNIDASKLADNFSAAAQGKTQLFKAEVEGTLQTAIARSNIDIRVEQGRTEAFNSISNRIIDQVLSNLTFETAAPEIEAGGTEAPELSATQVVSVSAVAEVIRSRLQTSFSYQQMTLPTETTAQTSVRLNHNFIDPRMVKVEIRHGFGSEEFSQPIKAGETFKISPFQFYVVRRRWKTKATYLTVNQLFRLGVDETFMLINDYRMALDNADMNGQFFALGKWWGGYLFRVPWNDLYRWKRYQHYPTRAGRINVTSYRIKELEDLKWTGIKVAFSNLGAADSYYLDELVGDHEQWFGEFKNGSVEITAKVDMGRMNLSKDFPKPYYKQKTRDGELLYPEAEEECDHDVEGDCKYLYDFRVTVKNIDEVVQEQHYGMGLGGSMARSEAFPINGRIDRWALEMYQSSEIIVTRPSLHENQPPMAAINHYKYMNTEGDPRENYVEGAE